MKQLWDVIRMRQQSLFCMLCCCYLLSLVLTHGNRHGTVNDEQNNLEFSYPLIQYTTRGFSIVSFVFNRSTPQTCFAVDKPVTLICFVQWAGCVLAKDLRSFGYFLAFNQVPSVQKLSYTRSRLVWITVRIKVTNQQILY